MGKAVLKSNEQQDARLYFNDWGFDFIKIDSCGAGQKLDLEEETHFGMWCIMSSPLLIGCDLTTISEASLRLLKNKELIVLNQDRLGLQAYAALRQSEGYVLVKDVEQLRGRTRAVALYNPSDTVCGFHVPLETLELAGTVKVRDVVR